MDLSTTTNLSYRKQYVLLMSTGVRVTKRAVSEMLADRQTDTQALA